MTITVQLFARAKDLLQAESVDVELPEGATVTELRHTLAERHPALSGLLERSAVAVNNDFVQDDVRLSAGCEVALIPPVSGGS